MHFTLTVASKTEAGTLAGVEHKFTLQGSFDAYNNVDSEPTPLGMLAIPASSEDFASVNIGDVLTFTREA